MNQKINTQQLNQIVNSNEGKQLKDLLSKEDPQRIAQAEAAIRAGNVEQAKSLLTPILANEDVKNLLQKLSHNMHG